MWIQYVSAIPDRGDPAGLVVTVGWTLNMTLRCLFVFFSFFFLVYCELWTNNRFINIIAITIIIVFYTDILLLF